jgi:pimeloyl-ACP methyl ester carboxylesterase
MRSAKRKVLFLNGAWHGPWAFEQWIPLFTEAGYDARALTLRGHGPGENGYRGVRLADYHQDVEVAMSELSEVPALVGHSLGGLIIQHLMGHRRLPAAVMLAPIPGRYPPGIIVRNSLRHPWVMAKSTIQNDLGVLLGTPKLARKFLFTPDTPAEVVSRCQMRLTGAWPPLFREMVATTPPDAVPGTPTLVLAPGRDAGFTAQMQRKLADRLDAHFRVIAGSGHDLPVDTPWREAAEATLDFLAEHAAVWPVAVSSAEGQ